MKFRFHRGGLTESLRTMVEGSKDDILQAIAEMHPGVVSCVHQGLDTRINWDSYLVLVDDVPVGYANEPL